MQAPAPLRGHDVLVRFLTDHETVGFQCGHAAESGGGDHLAEHVVGHVSGGKDSGHAGGRRAWNDLDVASRPHRKLTAERGCHRGMTYCDEDAIDLQGKCSPVRMFLSRSAFTPTLFIAEDLRYLGVPSYRYPWVLLQPLLEDLLRPQEAAAVNERDSLGKLGEIECLLDGGVAATYDRDPLPAKKEAVAGSAGRDASPTEPLRRWKA